MNYTINKITTFSILILASALYFTACQDSVNPSLEESVAPYLELEAIEGASNTTVTVNRGAAHGLDSYFSLDLSNFETNGLIGEGVTEGWCLEWNKPIRQNNDVHEGVELFNTFGSDTWKAPNYLMNIKNELKAENPEITYKEIQVALWSLIEEPAFNIDKVLQDGRMPSRMMTNGKPNFDVDKTKQIVNRVRNEVKEFTYEPGGPVIVFSKTGMDDQNVGGVTGTRVIVTSDDSKGWEERNVRDDGSSLESQMFPDQYGGHGSLSQSFSNSSGKTDYFYQENFGLVHELTSLGFEWYKSSSSTAPDHLTPAFSIYVSNGQGDVWLLKWEGAYNGYPTNGPGVPVNTWTTENTLEGNFWRLPQFINGNWVGYSGCTATGDPYGCFQFDRNLDDDWLEDFEVVALEVGIGSGWSGSYSSGVDFVNINDVTFDFEP